MFFDFKKQQWYRLIWDKEDNLLGSEWVPPHEVPPALAAIMLDDELNPT